VSRGSSSYRAISAVGARPQQQIRWPLLLLLMPLWIEGQTDRWTGGRTLDRFVTLAVYYADHISQRKYGATISADDAIQQLGPSLLSTGFAIWSS